ncbi:threonine synthase [Staphylococcus massiliensis]|uniref:Threonine synthase n=1 Tax=Staphylococcus massiliensis S46 TaxID=1229783 RepID=K9AXW6_9STAP|nr:threonine synthase [Staphylococcus massiliensis]EKU46355.1 threonine synthase [Staphylococcus massiliensis S46]MCG3401226.1 threonine synthase [Staphylococcus massiliensis]MCG3412597.1 threonine synthase [Staphylococcus massiliensis]POA01038.1 threonine synthase [Staphylococcus massiliensis CCUG 55927]
MKRWQGLVEEYKAYLPVDENTPKVSLNEGHTPLIYCDKMSEMLDIDLYVKFEGLNPTGSFKDRGMVMAVTKAKEAGKKIVICASTGNTSASAAAYAARAGMKAIVVIPEGKIALGKLSQAVMYGAEIVSIDGNFDEALEIVKEVAENSDIELVNSVNPFRIEGQKTAAFEVVEQLDGQAPDVLSIPVGNAGNITAYWKGFKEFDDKHQSGRPTLYGFQAEGASPIVQNKVVKNPETVATAIRIGNPASWDKALKALDESNGLIESVTDEEILEAYQLMAKNEGVFSEPASNASIAGLIKLHRQGKLPKGIKVVSVLTGNGLKDPDTAIDLLENPIQPLPNDKDKIIEYIENALK